MGWDGAKSAPGRGRMRRRQRNNFAKMTPTLPSPFQGEEMMKGFVARDVMHYSTSSMSFASPPNAFCASAASMNWSRSPSSTPPVFEVETPVRKSFTI
jgi:hypothetical protein